MDSALRLEGWDCFSVLRDEGKNVGHEPDPCTNFGSSPPLMESEEMEGWSRRKRKKNVNHSKIDS